MVNEQKTAKEVESKRQHRIDRSIVILGAGNMGSALMKGIINANLTPTAKITACGVHLDKLQRLSAQWKVNHSLNLVEAVEASEIVLLCVKPQTLPKVLSQVQKAVRKDHLLISIAAGVKIAFSQSAWASSVPIVRSMPNIASTVD